MRAYGWNRRSLLYAGLLLVSGLVAAAMVGEWLTANRQFQAAIEDLEQCHNLVRDIASLRNRPRVASLEVESPQQIIDRVAEAQAHSQLASESLVSVSPTAPTQLGNTEYQVRSTELVLQHLGLDQLVRFASALGIKEEGLVVRELTLTPDQSPPSEASNAHSNSTERWNARLILTQLIYSPTSK